MALAEYFDGKIVQQAPNEHAMSVVGVGSKEKRDGHAASDSVGQLGVLAFVGAIEGHGSLRAAGGVDDQARRQILHAILRRAANLLSYFGMKPMLHGLRGIQAALEHQVVRELPKRRVK